MTSLPRLLFFSLTATASLVITAGAQEWTRFRGPNGTGISVTQGVPAVWTEKEFAWRVPIAQIQERNYNLDLKNPHAKADLEHADPKDLVASMRAGEQDVMRLLAEIEALVSEA